MPIINMGTNIAFFHRLGGLGLDAENLGGMSLELALYLNNKLAYETFQKSIASKGHPLHGQINPNSTNSSDYANGTDSTDSTNSTNSTDDANYSEAMKSIKNQDKHERDVRCRNAGERGYKPSLLTSYGELTQSGQIKAEYARAVIADIERQQQDLTISPHLWENADDYFVKADIPLRALKMLNIVTKALTDAQTRIAMSNMAKLAGSTIPQTNSTNSTNSTNATGQPQTDKVTQEAQEAQESQSTQLGTIQDIHDYRDQLQIPDATCDIVFLNAPNGTQQPYAHTATLRQRGRTDLTILIKYGLVNLAGYRLGLAGRPKHVIWPSKVGYKVLSDLARLGIL